MEMEREVHLTFPARVRISTLACALLVLLCGCVAGRDRLGLSANGSEEVFPLSYRDAAFSQDGRLLATINLDRQSVTVFDTTNGEEALSFRPRELKRLKGVQGMRGINSIAAVTFTPKNHVIAACWLKQHEIGVWDITGSNLVARVPCGRAGKSLALATGAGQLAFVTREGRLAVRNIATGATLEIDIRTNRPALQFSPGGRLLAVVDKSEQVRLLETSPGEFVPGEVHTVGEVRHLSFSPDDRLIAVSARDLNIWTVGPWTNSLTVKSPEMKLGKRLAGIAYMLLSVAANRSELTEAAYGRHAGATVFSPDNKYLAVVTTTAGLGNALGGTARVVRVYDVRTGEVASRIDFKGEITSLAFSPDTSMLATAGLGAEVWDWRKATPTRAR